MGSALASLYVRKLPSSASASEFPVVLLLPLLLKERLPVYDERPFWSTRSRIITKPALTMCRLRIHEMLSATWASVYGEWRAKSGHLKLEYPETDTSGMPLRKLPRPLGKTLGNLKPDVERIQV